VAGPWPAHEKGPYKDKLFNKETGKIVIDDCINKKII